MWTPIDRIKANQNDATIFDNGKGGFALIAYVREFATINRYRIEHIDTKGEARSMAENMVHGQTIGYCKHLYVTF